MQSIIIGTAGHIDHGKTLLVEALTGTNADRLKEEQKRGITIDLGFAFLSDDIAIIDVPGHERFVKNMVAGAATVDFALLVVAADDGVMPQTREHFDILRLLGIEDGVTAITKCDLVDDDWLDLVTEDVRGMVSGSFLEERPIVRVDSKSGRGIEEVRTALIELARRQRRRSPGSIFRLPVDRVFTIKGFGTVVTGSALSGKVAIEDRLEILPRGLEVRVRGIESQGRKAPDASAGMRVSLNLSGVSVDDVSRGDVVSTPGLLKPTSLIDARCRILENSPIALEQRQRIRLHIGTKEAMARVVVIDRQRIDPGDEGLVQLRLEEQTVVQRLDRYVIRRYSPQVTIGGGQVLDANPQKHRKRLFKAVAKALDVLGGSGGEQLVAQMLEKEKVLAFEEIVTRSGLSADEIEAAVHSLCSDGQIIEIDSRGAKSYAARSALAAFEQEIGKALGDFHARNPLRVGAKPSEILSKIKAGLPEFALKRFLDLAVENLIVDSLGGDLIALNGFEINFTKKQRSAVGEIEKSLLHGRFQPPDLSAVARERGIAEKEARQLVQVLVDREKAINLEGKIYFHTDTVEEGVQKLIAAFKSKSELTMSEIRVLLDTTRKYALPLLNHYDNKGYTVRKGDIRVAGPKL